jgi:hypothetical protein
MSHASVVPTFADLIGAACFAHVLANAANVAKPANREQRRGPAADSSCCEGLRTDANLRQVQPDGAPDSQTFAAIRSQQGGPEGEERRGSSQNSQDSQSACATCAAQCFAAAFDERSANAEQRPRPGHRISVDRVINAATTLQRCAGASEAA